MRIIRQTMWKASGQAESRFLHLILAGILILAVVFCLLKPHEAYASDSTLDGTGTVASANVSAEEDTVEMPDPEAGASASSASLKSGISAVSAKPASDTPDQPNTGSGDSETTAKSDETQYVWFNEPASGTISVEKQWDDSLQNDDDKNSKRPIPVIVLTTTKQDQFTDGIQITFDANGYGKFGFGASGIRQNKVVYAEDKEFPGTYSVIAGTYEKPICENILTFDGWYLDPACTQKAPVSAEGNIGSADGFNADVTFYAGYSVKPQDFDYTGDEQEWAVPLDGNYQIEVWGAAGGHNSGYGGYAVGNIRLSKGEMLYIVVGGKGGTGTHFDIGEGGFNGGGRGGIHSDKRIINGGGGGGATHVAFVSGVLSSLSDQRDSILIVAGGGGGGSWDFTGGSGGGFTGASGQQFGSTTRAAGGAQDGDPEFFGHGQDGNQKSYWADCGAEGNGGGGGGYYGGHAYLSSGGHSNNGGGGGSGYIGNAALMDKHMAGYNVPTSNNIDTKTILVTAHSASPLADNAKEGNGYARITFISAN